MKDRYFWEQLIKNITELEFASLVEVMQEKSHTNKWDFLTKRKYEDEITDLEDELEDVRREAERLEDELLDAKLAPAYIENVIDLLENGQYDDALETLKAEAK